MKIKANTKSSDLIGKKVVPVKRLENNMGQIIDKGTVCTVTDSRRRVGISITTLPCESCGQQTTIKGVARESLEYFDSSVHAKPHIPDEIKTVLKDAAEFLNDVSGSQFETNRFFGNGFKPSGENVLGEREKEGFELYNRIKDVL